MSALSNQESEVFEITDFTTASEWERFIARIEEVIHDWKLTSVKRRPPIKKGEFTTGIWDEKCESVRFANYTFTITEFKLIQEDNEKEEETQEEDLEDAIPEGIEEMVSMENDFPPRAHCLCRWFGLRHFTVLTPAANSDAVISESRIKLLLSSISIAINNTSCQIPMFVQVQQKWRRMYLGQCEGPGVRTCFDMVHLKKIPYQFNHLAGLLGVFKSKIASPISPLPPVSVSVRFTYVLQDWTSYAWPQLPPDFDGPSGSEVGYSGFGKLPFGAVEDPVSELHLATTWPSLAEDMIVDNDVYTDLDPLQAPQWSVRIRMMEDPQCLLGEYLSDYAQLCKRSESTEQLLGRHAFQDDSGKTADISQALQRLTEPVPMHIPTLSSVVTRARTRIHHRKQEEEAPIHADLLNELLQFLFPDAGLLPNDAMTEPNNQYEERRDSSSAESHNSPDTSELRRQFKSAPEGSLTYLLAICMCVVNHTYGGVKAAAHLWQEFVLEMRFRWENNYTIPGLEPGAPNLGACLLHQKLQMLNCCIERKIAREGTPSISQSSSAVSFTNTQQNNSLQNDGVLPTSTSQSSMSSNPGQRSSVPSNQDEDDNDDEDDEFFECEDMTEIDDNQDNNPRGAECNSDDDMEVEEKDTKESSEKEQKEKSEKSSPEENADEFTDSVVFQPDGRLRQCGDLKLLNNEDLLYIPITQDPAPMTEDQLEEHAAVLAELGTSEEGAVLRAKMQSACLRSDMHAFKAANPTGVLADFVRWYSPRDWVEDEDSTMEDMETDDTGQRSSGKGKLSARMMIPGNMWQEVWSQARPVPARRQKRLFDDTKEAEKVLHFLASLKPADVALHLMPVLVHAAILRIQQIEIDGLPSLTTLLKQVTQRASKLTKTGCREIKKYEDVIKQIGLAEIVIARAQSLRAKFGQQLLEEEEKQSELEKFVSSLLEQPEVSILGAGRGPAGTIVHRLFAAAQRSANMLPSEEELLGEEENNGSQQQSVSVPDFPRPAGREFILRTIVPRPAPYSRALPQRMFCILMNKEFRLAGAFTEDTTFF
ncbi:rab3 GTPase-activating protein catalytic subunit-like [Glandiceps talaboti]